MDNLNQNREDLMKKISEIAGSDEHEGYNKLILPAALAGVVLVCGLFAASVFTSQPKVQPTMFATTIDGANPQVEVKNTHNEFN